MEKEQRLTTIYKKEDLTSASSAEKANYYI